MYSFVLSLMLTAACGQPQATQDPYSPDAMKLLHEGKAIKLTFDGTYAGESMPHASGLPNGLKPGTHTMKLENFSMDDYVYLTFSYNGSTVDFSNGTNNLDGFGELGEPTDDGGSIAPELIGKMFEVTWEMKTSTFMCCEGAMDTWVGMNPSITSVSPK